MKRRPTESILKEISCEDCSATGDLQNPFHSLQTELSEGLALYWQGARNVLEGSGIRLAPPESRALSLEQNFFSALFLYSYYRCHIPKDRRILYTAVNQCLRGMVTGCDNLLDDEYKMTLDTDLPETGTRFRSVLDIMVSDRVLFEILLARLDGLEFTAEVLQKAVRASLHALTLSGTQEASEEKGVAEKRLPPDSILSNVHHFKTGLLFQCPWAVPAVMEKSLSKDVKQVKDALYRIGIGCQILDDMVDLENDIRERRHNYIASMIVWGRDEELKRLLTEMESSKTLEFVPGAFSHILPHGYVIAMDYLKEGLRHLFIQDHQALVEQSADFIVERIGAGDMVRFGGKDES